MRNLIVFLTILFVITGCKKDEIKTAPQKLKNCNIPYLYFVDEVFLASGRETIFMPNDTLCSYSFSGNYVSKVTGGFVMFPSGTNISSLIFSKDVYDSIVFNSNRVSIYQKYSFANSVDENTFNPMVFTMDSQQRLQKITIKDGYHPDGRDINYTYSDTLIKEIAYNGYDERTFYFKNNNLEKVVSKRKNSQGEYYLVREILFQNYDNSPNPFKNMYYVRGAFYRAFSENNYTKITNNEYGYLIDGTFGITAHSWWSMPISYNADGYPKFGEYEAQ